MDNFLEKNNIFLISIGAVPAAIFRWQIDDLFIVNIIGCFLLGFINTAVLSRKYKIIFGFGFCGSLTSFGGLSFHLFELISQHFYKLFFLNLIAIILISLCALYFGHLLAKKINP